MESWQGPGYESIGRSEACMSLCSCNHISAKSILRSMHSGFVKHWEQVTNAMWSFYISPFTLANQFQISLRLSGLKKAVSEVH